MEATWSSVVETVALCLLKQCAATPKLELRIRSFPVRVSLVLTHLASVKLGSATLHLRLIAADSESLSVHRDSKVTTQSGDFEKKMGWR